MSLAMTCEYCNSLWNERHSCVGSVLSAKLETSLQNEAGHFVMISDLQKQLERAKEVLWKIKREVYRHKNACDCGVCSAHALLEKWSED